jgi:hypothetical protein
MVGNHWAQSEWVARRFGKGSSPVVWKKLVQLVSNGTASIACHPLAQCTMKRTRNGSFSEVSCYGFAKLDNISEILSMKRCFARG